MRRLKLFADRYSDSRSALPKLEDKQNSEVIAIDHNLDRYFIKLLRTHIDHPVLRLEMHIAIQLKQHQ